MDKVITAVVWGVLLLLFVLAEAATVSLVSVWFMAGSLVALIVTLLGGPVWLQVLLFFLVSIAALALLRPLLKKYIRPRITATNADALVGKTGVVTEAIDNLRDTGCVRVAGVLWSARSTGGEDIPLSSVVVVRKVESAKLIVDPVLEKEGMSI